MKNVVKSTIIVKMTSFQQGNKIAIQISIKANCVSLRWPSRPWAYGDQGQRWLGTIIYLDIWGVGSVEVGVSLSGRAGTRTNSCLLV